MGQRHSIILWKKAEEENKDFLQIAKEAYGVMKLFQDYPQELRPSYLTVKTKKEIEVFDWSFENFSRVLKKGINKDGENTFEDLGYAISFFSAMDEKDSCTFQMRAGNKNEKFYNTLIINLPLSLDVYNEKIAEEISILFKKLMQAYIPYWGCISNKLLSRKYGKLMESNLPTTVHWLNYWSEDTIRTIGMEKILRIVDENPLVTFKSGIFSIKDTALDVNKEEDIRYHNKLHKQLFL